MNVFNEFEQAIELARTWIEKGKFVYNGLTYTRGINEHSACKILSELATLRITDLAFHFDDLMCVSMGAGGIPAKGFTIGRGKAIYWYVTPMARSGTYRCMRQYDNGEIGAPRSISPTQIVTVQYQ